MFKCSSVFGEEYITYFYLFIIIYKINWLAASSKILNLLLFNLLNKWKRWFKIILYGLCSVFKNLTALIQRS